MASADRPQSPTLTPARNAATAAGLGSHAPSAEDRFVAFETSRLQLIQKSLILARIGVPLLALITGGLFSVWIDLRVVIAWAVIYALATIAAVTVVGRMRTDTKDAGIARRNILHAGLLLSVSNLIWASIAIVFWVPGDVTNHFLIILLLASGVPYAIATTAASLRSYSISVAPLVAALILRPLLEGDSLYYGVTALDLVYCVMMFSVALQLHRTLTTMLQIKENNAELLIQVAKAKAESDAARYRAERLNQAKSTFLANMSHELRTPLNAILGFSEVIHNEMLGPIGTPTYKDYAGDIHSSGRHLLGLINDILDLSRIEAGRVDLAPVVLSVNELVSDTIRLTEGAAKKSSVKLVRKVPEDLAYIRADERAMRQVLLNLLSNAIKFTPKDGTVSVSAEMGSSVFGPKGLTMTVEDTGIGIKKEDMSVVLEAFGQVRVEDLAMTAPREQGTGLGLPIVRGLLEAHGGKFVLESEFGVGTRAIMHLPPRCVLGPAEVDEPRVEMAPIPKPKAKRA